MMNKIKIEQSLSGSVLAQLTERLLDDVVKHS